MIVNATNSTFDSIIESNELVLVDFWEDWCNPCKAMMPSLEAIAEEYKDTLKVVKVKVGDEAKIAQTYMIRSLPTIILFKNGKLHKQHIGTMSKKQLTDFIRV